MTDQTQNTPNADHLTPEQAALSCVAILAMILIDAMRIASEDNGKRQVTDALMMIDELDKQSPRLTALLQRATGEFLHPPAPPSSPPDGVAKGGDNPET